MYDFFDSILTKINQAKQDYIEGNDVFDVLNELDTEVSKKAIELGLVGKMSKSEAENA